MNISDLQEIVYNAGRTNALSLRGEAKNLDGTAIISRELDVPEFFPGMDYSAWPVGAPVADGSQIWQLLQPYDSSAHPGRPGELRALWGLCHTKNPDDAKAWVDPYGTSGMYMEGECYRAADGTVYRCLSDNTIFNAGALPSGWEAVTA